MFALDDDLDSDSGPAAAEDLPPETATDPPGPAQHEGSVPGAAEQGAAPVVDAPAASAEQTVEPDEQPADQPRACEPPCQDAAEVPAGGVDEELRALRAELVLLRQLFNQKIRGDDMSQKALERLHREMQDYKDNFLQKAMEPTLRGLIGLADHMDEVIAAGDYSEQSLNFLRDELLEVLWRCSVEPFAADAADFDPGTQKVARTEPTDDQSLHRRVLRSLKPGYSLDGRVLRPEHVVIHKYAGPAPTAVDAVTTDDKDGQDE